MPEVATTAPLRMPAAHLEVLATGGDTPQALAFLRAAERSRRLLLLDRLRTLALRTAPERTAAALAALHQAALRDPDAVERLLLAPQTGTWLAHTERRAAAGADRDELDRLTAHLGALALTAGLLTRTSVRLELPLAAGTLFLPQLGSWEVAVPPGASAEVTTENGALTLHHATARLEPLAPRLEPLAPRLEPLAPRLEPLAPRLEPLTPRLEPLSPRLQPGWRPLHHLRRDPPLVLDDLDPYRDLDTPVPARPLSPAETLAWQRLYDQAAALVAADSPGAPGTPALDEIRTIVPWEAPEGPPDPSDPTRLSATTGDGYAGMIVARPHSPLYLAETLVHELQHSKLAALLHLFPLLHDDRREIHYAPWRCDPRHLTGLLHGAYAFTAVTGYWLHRHTDSKSPVAAYYFALRRSQVRDVLRTLRRHARPTPPGRRLLAGLAATLDAWLQLPVPAGALRRAELARRLHRTEWNFRNRMPRAGAPVGWRDTRTPLFAEPVSSPHTPDELLAAGRTAEAVRAYRARLRTDPADVSALAGLRVAERN